MGRKKKYISRIGIYQIQSMICPDRIYIGSSTNIPARWYGHKHSLLKNDHHSLKLQEHYNKYGLDDLKFSVIMNCNIDEIEKLEQYYIDMLNPYFNIFKFVIGSKKPIRNKKDMLACTKSTEEKRWMQGSSFYYCLCC
jgi:group I intron endonuclease